MTNPLGKVFVEVLDHPPFREKYHRPSFRPSFNQSEESLYDDEVDEKTQGNVAPDVRGYVGHEKHPNHKMQHDIT